MPPRRRAAAPPAKKPLEECVVAISGKFEGHSHGEVEEMVRDLGGSISKSVTSSTTHVICTQFDYTKGTTKTKAGKANDLHLVSPDWLIESGAAKKKLKENDYSWPTLLANTAASNGSTGGGAGKKRPNKASQDDKNGSGDDDEEQEEDDEPVAKKAKNSKAAPAKGKGKGKGKASVKADADDDQNDTEESREDKVVAEGQFVKKKDVVIPLDEGCPLATYLVYVDPSGMIYDASLNQSNSSNNNNKFYRIQVLREPKSGDFKTWTRWGRVGEFGQKAILGDGSEASAIKNFEKKFRDKSGLPWEKRGDDPKPGKYAFVERSYNPDDSDDDDDADTKAPKKEDGEEDEAPEPECTLKKPVKELMELIFNPDFFQATMSDLNYDANKLPLGKLSQSTIKRGFQVLKDLAALMDDSTLASSKWNMSVASATEHLSNTYYSVIPHAFGRNRPPIIRTNAMLKKEVTLLESLSDMKDAAEIMKIDRKTRDTVHQLDRQFQGLGMEEMTPLDHESNEFSRLAHYLNESRGSTHHVNYKIQDIYRIERQGETKRFNDSPYASIQSDRRLLWHGSRCTNFGGILSQGLRIAPPEAPVNGYMFGKGIYLADMSSKSAGYCCSRSSGGNALLLLCEAELGDPMQKLTGASYTAGEDAKKQGMYSTWGQGRVGPSSWVDAGAVHDDLKGIKMPDPDIKPADTNVPDAGLFYNEYIAYDLAQVKLRYLFRVKM